MRIVKAIHILLMFLAVKPSCSITNPYSPDTEYKKQMYKRNSGLPLRNFFQQRLRGQNLTRLPNLSMWSQYAPNTPAPDEVECEFTIEVPQFVGGRCVRLGGIYRMAVCQSGVHLDFLRNDCERILAEREANVNGQQEHVHSQNIGQHQIQQRSVKADRRVPQERLTEDANP